jgi:hypothetical protein
LFPAKVTTQTRACVSIPCCEGMGGQKRRHLRNYGSNAPGRIVCTEFHDLVDLRACPARARSDREDGHECSPIKQPGSKFLVGTSPDRALHPLLLRERCEAVAIHQQRALPRLTMMLPNVFPGVPVISSDSDLSFHSTPHPLLPPQPTRQSAPRLLPGFGWKMIASSWNTTSHISTRKILASS